MTSASNLAPAPELLARFAAIVGEKYAVTDPAALAPFLVEGRGLYHGRSRDAAAARHGRRSSGDPQARQRDRNAAGAAGRQYRAGRRPDSARRRGDPFAHPARQDPRGRSGLQHHDLRGRRGAGQGAGSRGQRRPAVPAVARRRGKLHHRRQPLHQCRRHRRAGLRHHARSGARAGSGAGRRAHPAAAAKAEKGQHRLRPAAHLHRRRRHAWHHHRGGAQAVSAAARGGDRLCRRALAGGGAQALASGAGARRRHGHQLRADRARDHRIRHSPRPRRARSACGQRIPGTC